MLIEFLEKNWANIIESPDTFIYFAIVIISIVFFIVRFHYSGRIDILNENINLKKAKIDEYEKKLSVSSPDEALERINILEGRVSGLEPMVLDKTQCERLFDALSISPGEVSITNEGSSYKANKLRTQLSDIFHKAGWKVRSGVHFAVANPSETGVLVEWVTGNPLGRQVYAAFKGIGLNPAFKEFHRPFDIEVVSIVLSEPR